MAVSAPNLKRSGQVSCQGPKGAMGEALPHRAAAVEGGSHPQGHSIMARRSRGKEPNLSLLPSSISFWSFHWPRPGRSQRHQRPQEVPSWGTDQSREDSVLHGKLGVWETNRD